jgi:hypothetical protein
MFLPPGYVCHRCGIPGHYIKQCPTNGDDRYNDHKIKTYSDVRRVNIFYLKLIILIFCVYFSLSTSSLNSFPLLMSLKICQSHLSLIFVRSSIYNLSPLLVYPWRGLFMLMILIKPLGRANKFSKWLMEASHISKIALIALRIRWLASH